MTSHARMQYLPRSAGSLARLLGERSGWLAVKAARLSHLALLLAASSVTCHVPAGCACSDSSPFVGVCLVRRLRAARALY